VPWRLSKNMPLSVDVVKSTLLPYTSQVDAGQATRIISYIDLLSFWSRKLSLTSIVDPNDILRFHFGESLFALQFLNLDQGRLADVGTGSGFPGLAIKILRPRLAVTLLEPNRKKCVFLAEVIRRLELQSVEIIPKRFEEFSPGTEIFDSVATRALGNYASILKWSRETLRKGGYLILWISSDDLGQATSSSGWKWHPSRSIPDTTKRKILVGVKTA
jgi:16S rRNA (guanine527-N7)-methyltransferase